MIQTIRIGHLLREAVTTPYRCLVTRRTGAAVRGRIEEALAASDCQTALLDFSDIELLDLSCADEVVAKLLLAEAGVRPRCLVLRGLREDQHEAIEHVLNHHRLAVTVTFRGDVAPRLLGWAGPDARAAFACLCELGAAGAADLAGALEWPESRARDALQGLLARRLIRSSRVESHGERYHPLPTA